MKRRQFLIIAGVWLCVSFWVGAVSADARMFKKREVRPRALIAVRGESLALQNNMIDRFCLVRFEDSKMLDEYIREPEKFFKGKACVFDAHTHTILQVRSGYLDVVDMRGAYAILPARDWVRQRGQEFYQQFHKKLKITSLLRTRKDQQGVVENGESVADGATPERESAHTAGVAVDISKKDVGGNQLSRKEIRWLEKKLIADMRAEKIIAVEELYTNSFHVVVYPDWEKK